MRTGGRGVTGLCCSEKQWQELQQQLPLHVLSWQLAVRSAAAPGLLVATL